MQIDWITVAAQIVNFLVLVWLLQRFLYKPITGAMRRREERIEERLAEAREAREKAEEEARKLRKKEEELEASKDEILGKAREEAANLRERLEAEIREDMEDKRAAWQEHLAEERDAFVASLQRQAGTRVLEITERVLADYADTDTAARVVATFTDRLRSLDEDARARMTEAAAAQDEPALVQTDSELDSAAKGRITRAIHETLSTDIPIDYRKDRDMVFGARLTIGDHTVEWSASRYLDRLGTELREIIDAGTGKPGGEKAMSAGDDDGGDDDRDRTAQENDRETA